MSNFFSQTPTLATRTHKHDSERADGGFVHGFDFIDPETQKARGIVLLHEKKARVLKNLGWKVPRHLPFASGTQFSASSFNFPVFGRPCPTVPRHGFVDSIVCKDSDALNALSSETYDVEEGAEILVTKPVDCSFNAIATGGVITIGGGNDGATSGKGVRYFYIADDPIGNAIQIEKHQEQFDRLKHQLQAKMQEAERATFTNGSVTWKKSKDSISLDSKALLKQHPEYLSQFPQSKQGSRRFNIYTD